MSRYIGKTVASSIGLVTLVLVGLQMFILFVGELNDLGAGDYTLTEAFAYIVMQMPYQVYLFFPVASLIGCLIGLGSLASNSELIAIRSAGATVFQLARATMKAAIILIILVTVLGESMMHQWVHASEERKVILRSGSKEFILYHGGIWLRNGQNFVYVTAISPHHQLEEVKQYQFNDKHELILTRAIHQLEYNDHHWWMLDAVESDLSADRVTTKRYDKALWDVPLPPALLGLVDIEPDQMTLSELSHYIEIAHKQHQEARRYELDYWQRLFQPIVSCIMVFLAIPFIFGPLRQSSMGSRIVLGTFFGFGFHIIDKFFGSASLVYQFSPFIGAAGPTIIFGIIAFFMMRRVK